jgi:hypothetical protein
MVIAQRRMEPKELPNFPNRRSRIRAIFSSSMHRVEPHQRLVDAKEYQLERGIPRYRTVNVAGRATRMINHRIKSKDAENCVDRGIQGPPQRHKEGLSVCPGTLLHLL